MPLGTHSKTFVFSGYEYCKYHSGAMVMDELTKGLRDLNEKKSNGLCDIDLGYLIS